MKPEVDTILGISAGHLMGALAPQLPAGYSQGGAALLGIMMTFSAQEYDRAAEIRVRENDDMRALFREAAGKVADQELKAMVMRAGETRDVSLRISALNAENTELRRVLIRLQSYAEEHGLGDVERRIWDVLKASAERRLIRLA